jgi:predicted Na+-dependent transporter
MPEWLLSFWHDARVETILALIALHIISVILVAIKDRYFDWTALADFYRQLVVPYLLGYLIVYLFAEAVADLETYLGQGLATLFWLPLVSSLVARIKQTWRSLGVPLEEEVRTLREHGQVLRRQMHY